jgi:hypothetical protein
MLTAVGVRGRARRAWNALARRGCAPPVWRAALYLALFAVLLVADAICSSASLPVVVTRDAGGVTIQAGSVTRHIATRAQLVAVSLPARDPVDHEYQLDGTDSANNYTLDLTYLHSIANTTYYRLTAWMRGLDNLSRWRDLCVASEARAALCLAAPPIASGATLTIPGGDIQRVTLSLQQPETTVALDLTLSDTTAIALTVDPNDHIISITQLDPAHPNLTPINAYYPNDPGDLWPQAAMVLDLLIRVLLWSLAILGGVWVIETAVGWLGALGWEGLAAQAAVDGVAAKKPGCADSKSESAQASDVAGWPKRREFRRLPARSLPALRAAWERLTRAIHPAGLALIAAAFGFACWIALAQYHAQPHIYDASAYFFGAKILALGRLSVPAPAAPGQFPGPFMVISGGRWFPQYAPGTSAALALGVLLGVPWLIEPLLGALALLGIGLTLRRLYDRRVATVAVALGAISPFFLWLTASYLSHAVALCLLVWGLWALTRFAQGGRGWNLPLAAALWGLAWLTRDSAAPFALVALAGLGWVAWRERWPVLKRRWAAPLAWTALALGATLVAYFYYNAALTGSPFMTPRSLFFPGDHWGFGPGVGFYGQHTLAAGFITVDALLTSLSITLYGWPFYLTLAFIPLPFLARRARAADLFLLAGALVMTFIWLGYFYHGVYLGPRYLYEALPFLLGLTARGIITLYEVGRAARGSWRMNSRPDGPEASMSAYEDAKAPAGHLGLALPGVAAPALLLGLLGWAALYYFPRQIALHTNFTGMGAGTTLETAALSHPPVHHAIVITDNGQLYGYTLFALNDPLLRGDVLYAYGASGSDYATLRRAYPDRRLYLLTFDSHGQPQYTLLDG